MLFFTDFMFTLVFRRLIPYALSNFLKIKNKPSKRSIQQDNSAKKETFHIKMKLWKFNSIEVAVLKF